MITELTSTMIASFKKCPRRYELEYIYDLKPITTDEALSTGTSYHANVEKILRGEDFDHSGLTGLMAEVFKNYIPWGDWNASPEVEFCKRISHGIYIKGKMDAVTFEGLPVEHKTTGQSDMSKYIYHLAYDDQITTYMLAAGKTKAIYTVIQKPTIRQKQDETEEGYLERCRAWYTPDKITQQIITRTPKELAQKKEEIEYIAKEIRHKKMFWRNPNTCALTSCAYASICLNYQPGMQLIGFKKKERRNEELCKY